MSCSRVIAIWLLAFNIGTAASWADNKSIQGTLLGLDGKPMAGGEIKANRLDAKGTPALTKTDAQGHYLFKGLPVGAYAITAYVKGVGNWGEWGKTRDAAGEKTA